MCLVATLFSIALVLNGCGGNDSKALKIAEQLVTQSLKSPSSFSATSTKIVFKGVNSEGDPAYIVRVDYDAQNGFGAMLRGCNLAAFYLKSGDKFGYKQNGLDSCMGSPGTEDEAFGIEINRKFNEFTDAKAAASAAASSKAATIIPAISAAVTVEHNTTPKNAYNLDSSRDGRFGKLSIRYAENGGLALFANDIQLPENFGSYSLRIQEQWQIRGRDVYLLMLAAQDNCVVYLFAMIEKGSAGVSKRFGNCNAFPEIKENGSELTVDLAGQNGTEALTARFADGQLFIRKMGSSEERTGINHVPI